MHQKIFFSAKFIDEPHMYVRTINKATLKKIVATRAVNLKKISHQKEINDAHKIT